MSATVIETEHGTATRLDDERLIAYLYRGCLVVLEQTRPKEHYGVSVYHITTDEGDVESGYVGSHGGVYYAPEDAAPVAFEAVDRLLAQRRRHGIPESFATRLLDLQRWFLVGRQVR